MKKKYLVLTKQELYNISVEYSKIQKIGELSSLIQVLKQLGSNLNTFHTKTEIPVDGNALVLLKIKNGI